VREYSGDLNVDLRSKVKWQEELSKHQIREYTKLKSNAKEERDACILILY
jgi:hypothetical protein